MGFDLAFALHRATPLAPDELDTLAQHLRTWRGKIIGYDWHVPSGTTSSDLIAWGSLRPTRGNPNVSDQGGYLADVVERLHDALAEVRDLIRNATLAFSDDFGALEWTASGFDYRKTAAHANVPYGDAGWTSLAAARNIPDGRDAIEAAKAARAALPKSKAAAAAALADTPRDALIERVLAPLNGSVSDIERTAAVERLGADPDPAAIAALVQRTRHDGMERKWTPAIMHTLAEAPRRCSWATALLALDRGWPGAAQLVVATMTDDALPHLARMPEEPTFVVQALEAVDSPAAREAKRSLVDATTDRPDAARLAVVDAVLAARRVLRSSSAWTGTGPALPVLDADPNVRRALEQVGSAIAAFRLAGGDLAPWYAHDKKAGAKALVILDGKRVTQEIVDRGLTALADYPLTEIKRVRLDASHRVEVWQLEADWLAAHGYPT